MVVDLGVVLIGAACLIFVAAVIPALIEFRKTLAEFNDMIRLLKQELLPLLQEMHEVSRHVNEVAEHVESGAEHTSAFFRAIGGLGSSIQHVQDLLHTRGGSIMTNSLVLGAGVRAATSILVKRLRQRSTTNGQ